MNVLFGTIWLYGTFRIDAPEVEAQKKIEIPGTYGPPAMEIIDDDATISTADVTLRNTLISGNLYLTADITGGTITLDRVEVQGVVIIAGGSYTLKLSDCTLAGVTVQENSGALTIVAGGATGIDMVSLAAETSLQEDGLQDSAQGFNDVKVVTKNKVLLLGSFGAVDIMAPEANVKVLKGSVSTLNIQSAAAGTTLDLAPEVAVENLILDARMTLTGSGSVAITDINAAGLIQLGGVLGEVVCHAEGIFLDLLTGSIANLIVPELETATSINLAADTTTEFLELNAKAGVTGSGRIAKAIINSMGVNISQTPAKIVLAEGLVAMIGGEEYKIEPEPEPEPEKPSVKINNLSNITLMTGKSATKTITVSPKGAKLTASSNDSNKAAVSLSGTTLTVTAKKSGTVTVTVRASKDGYTSDTETFKVYVHAPTDIKSFEVRKEGALKPGFKLIFVTLYASDPSSYKVSVAGVPLTYIPGDKVFYGEVPEEDAKQAKVKVSK